jgi:hypothetical protein
MSEMAKVHSGGLELSRSLEGLGVSYNLNNPYDTVA